MELEIHEQEFFPQERLIDHNICEKINIALLRKI
jgi:hypothetical protein